jgi:hypothetical protein
MKRLNNPLRITRHNDKLASTLDASYKRVDVAHFKLMDEMADDFNAMAIMKLNTSKRDIKACYAFLMERLLEIIDEEISARNTHFNETLEQLEERHVKTRIKVASIMDERKALELARGLRKAA